MYICIDFDGTIVDHAFPEIGAPVPKAIYWIKKFQDAGAQIILWTVRCNESSYGTVLDDAVIYLRENDISLFGINENPHQKSFSKSRKAYGHIYIDDAAYGCPLIEIPGFNRPCVDWEKVGPDILKII